MTAWGKKAEFIEKHIKKGTRIDVEGKLQYDSYEDKSGNKKNSTTILIDEILILNSNK